MSKKLNNKDFIEEGFGKPLIDFFKLLDEHIDKSTANIKELAGVLKKDISNNKLSTGADVQKLNEQKEQANALKRIQTEQKQAQKELSKIAEIESKKQAKIEQDRRKEIEKTVNFERRERLKLANDLIKQRQKDIASAKKQADKIKAQQQKQIERQQKLIQKNKAEQGSLKQLRQQLSLTTKAYDELSKEERENENVGGALVKQIKEQQKELRKLEEATGRAQRNVGNYKSALGNLKGFLIKGIGILGLSSALDSLGSGLKNLTLDLSKITNQVKLFGETNEETAKSVANTVLAISSSFDESTEEILQSANVVSKEFGISLEEALQKIKLGFVSGSNASGEFLEILKEYPAQLTTVGLSADESFALINQQVTQGIYSDKGVDSIKEAGLRLREMPKATKEALDAIGLSSKEIQSSIENGTKSIFQVIQLVSNKMGELPPQSAKVGTAIADIFGSAGEDAGLKFLKTLGDIDLTITSTTENLNNYQQSQLELVTAQEGLNKVVNDFFNDSATSFNKLKTAAISFATKGLKFIADNFESIVNVLKLVSVGFIAFKVSIIATNLALSINTARTKIASIAMNLFTGRIKRVRVSFRALNTTMKANVIGLVISAITIAITAFFAFREEVDENTEALKKLKEEAGEAGATLQNRFDARLKLSTQQLKNLKSDIQESISLQEKELESETSIAVAQNKLIQNRIDFNKKEIESENERFNKFKSNFEENSVTVKQEEKDLKERIKILNDKIEAEEKNLVNVKDSTKETEKEKEQIKILNELLKQKNKLTKESNKESDKEIKKGLLEQIDEKIKQARAKQRATESKDEITKQQIKIKELEEERRILLDIGEIKKQTAKQAETDDKKEDERREKRGKEKLKALEEEVKSNEDAEKEKRKFQDETIAKAFEAGEKLLDRLNDITNKNLDARIEASSKNQDRLTTLAASGNKEASKSLAQEADNQRNLEQERARTIRRQTAQAVILAGLELTIAAARRGDEQPAQTASNQLSSNISNSESLAGNISNLAGFFTGTEKVSQDLAENKFYDGKDGYAVRVHGTERIIQGNDNQKLEGLSNAELVNAGVLYKKGGFDYHKYAGEVQSVNNVMINDNKEVVNELKDLKKAFINNQKSIDFSIDPINKHLIKETKEQGRKLRKHYKNGRLF